AHRRDPDPAPVEDVQELLEAVAARAEQVRLRHAAVVEAERPGVGRVPAHLPVRLALLVAGGPVGDDDVRDLAGAVLARARGARPAAGDLGPGVGDELFRAVDPPLAALELRPRAGAARVRARLGLGEAEARELAPRAQLRKPLLFLLRRAPEVDRHRPER